MFKLSKKLSGLLLLSLTQVNLVEAGVIDLGVVGDSIIASGSSVTLGSEANIYGNVAGTTQVSLGSGAIIQKNACSNHVAVGSGAAVKGKSGSGACTDINKVKDDISSASTQLSSMRPRTRSSLSINSTTNLSAGSYWVNDLDLETGESLFITGDKNSKAVINVVGNAKIGSGASIKLLGGILAENVFFNFLDNSHYRSFELGGSNISGTFISKSRDFILGDGAKLENTRFFTNGSITANVQDVKFGTVPEPGTWSLFIGLVIALVSFQYFRSRKSALKTKLVG